MSTPKDYDTTLARMAGNIAAGLVSGMLHLRVESDTESRTASTAVRIAQAIITKCREQAKQEAGASGDRRPIATFKGETPIVLGTMPCHTLACGWDGRSRSTAAVIRFLGHTRMWCDVCGGCWGITDREIREKMV